MADIVGQPNEGVNQPPEQVPTCPECAHLLGLYYAECPTCAHHASDYTYAEYLAASRGDA